MHDEIEDGVGQGVNIARVEHPVRVAQELRCAHGSRAAEGEQRLDLDFGVPPGCASGLDALAKRLHPRCARLAQLVVGDTLHLWMVDRAEVRRVVARELYVGATECPIASNRIGSGRLGTGIHGLDTSSEALLGQLAEESAAIGEVSGGRGVRDAEIARESAKAQSFDSTLGDHLRRPLEQSFSQISVVVGHVAPIIKLDAV